MTVNEVQSLVRSQIAEDLKAKTEQRIALEHMILWPQVASVIALSTPPLEDEELDVWLIGEESPEGYKIIMQNDGKQFGLAATGFPNGKRLVLVGWYGSLKSAFWGCDGGRIGANDLVFTETCVLAQS